MAELLGSQEFNMTRVEGSTSLSTPSNPDGNHDPNVTLEPASGFWLALPGEAEGDVEGPKDDQVKRKNSDNSVETKQRLASDSIEVLTENSVQIVSDNNPKENVMEHCEKSNENMVKSLGQKLGNRVYTKKDIDELEVLADRTLGTSTALSTENEAFQNERNKEKNWNYFDNPDKTSTVSVPVKFDRDKIEDHHSYKTDDKGEVHRDSDETDLKHILNSPLEGESLIQRRRIKSYKSEDDEIVCVHDTSDCKRSSLQSTTSSSTTSFLQSKSPRKLDRLSQHKTSLAKRVSDLNTQDEELPLSCGSSDSDKTEIFDGESSCTDAQRFDDNDLVFDTFLNKDVLQKKNSEKFEGQTETELRENCTSSESRSLSKKLTENMKKNVLSSSLQSKAASHVSKSKSNGRGGKPTFCEVDENSVEGTKTETKTVEHRFSKKHELDSKSDKDDDAVTTVYDETENSDVDCDSEDGGARTIMYDEGEKHGVFSESEEEGGAKTIIYDDTEAHVVDSESEEEGGANTIIYDESEKHVINNEDNEEDGDKTISYDSDESLVVPESNHNTEATTTTCHEASGVSAQGNHAVGGKDSLSDAIPFQKQKKSFNRSDKNLKESSTGKKNSTFTSVVSDLVKNRTEGSENSLQYLTDTDAEETKLYISDDSPQAVESSSRGSSHSDSNICDRSVSSRGLASKKVTKSCKLDQQSHGEDLDRTLPFEEFLNTEQTATHDIVKASKDTMHSKHKSEVSLPALNNTKADAPKTIPADVLNHCEKTVSDEIRNDLEETLPYKEMADDNEMVVCKDSSTRSKKKDLYEAVDDDQNTIAYEDDVLTDHTTTFDILKAFEDTMPSERESKATALPNTASDAQETVLFEDFSLLKKTVPYEMGKGLKKTVPRKEMADENEACVSKGSLSQRSRKQDLYQRVNDKQEFTQDNSNLPHRMVNEFVQMPSYKKPSNKCEIVLDKDLGANNGSIPQRNIQQKDCESVLLQAKESHVGIGSPFYSTNETLKKLKLKISNSTPKMSTVQKKIFLPVFSSVRKTEESSKAETFTKDMCARFVIDWSTLLISGEESDVTISVDDEQELNAHSIVLLTRCSELHAEAKNMSKNVKWEGVSYEGAYAFLVYLYTGNCSVDTRDDPLWIEVFDLALKYNCEELIAYLESLYKIGSSPVKNKKPDCEAFEEELSASKLLPRSLKSVSKVTKGTEIVSSSSSFQTSTIIKETRPITAVNSDTSSLQSAKEVEPCNLKEINHSNFNTPKIGKEGEAGRSKMVRRCLDLSPIVSERNVCNSDENIQVRDDLGDKSSTENFSRMRSQNTATDLSKRMSKQDSTGNLSKSVVKISKTVLSSQSPDLFESTASMENVSFITTPPKSPLSISSLQNALGDTTSRKSVTAFIDPKMKVPDDIPEGCHTPKKSFDTSVDDDIQPDENDVELSSRFDGKVKPHCSITDGSYLANDVHDGREDLNSVQDESRKKEVDSENRVPLDNVGHDGFENKVENDDNLIDLTNDNSDDSCCGFEAGRKNVTEDHLSRLDVNNSEEDMEPLKLADSEESSKETSDVSHSHEIASNKGETLERESEIAVDIICPSPKSVDMNDNSEDLGCAGVDNEDQNAYISNVWDDFDDGGCELPMNFPVTPAKDCDDEVVSNASLLSVEKTHMQKDNRTNDHNTDSEYQLSPKSDLASPVSHSSPSELLNLETSNLPGTVIGIQDALHNDGDAPAISDDTMAKIQADFDDSGLWKEEFEPIFEEEEAEQGTSSKGTQHASRGVQRRCFKTPKHQLKAKKIVTPMPNYKEMPSPELKVSLDFVLIYSTIILLITTKFQIQSYFHAFFLKKKKVMKMFAMNTSSPLVNIILSRATKGKSNPQPEKLRKGIIVKDKKFYKPTLNTLPTR